MGYDFNPDREKIAGMEALAKKARRDAMRMIQSAGSGHIGGSFSSMDIYTALWSCKRECDKVVVSHGHTAAAVYAVLGNLGYFDVENAVCRFRRGREFEGHPSLSLPEVNWCNGALGQGLSIGCGIALVKKIKKEDGTVFVVMGDGEQQKGQLQEAREFAAMHGLSNLVGIIDYNAQQSTGPVSTITMQDVKAKYEAAGWMVTQADGHDLVQVCRALEKKDGPRLVLAQTIMGKGLAPIEGNYKYHGNLIGDDLYELGLKTFEISREEQEIIDGLRRERIGGKKTGKAKLKTGERILYAADEKTDCRSAFGKALADIAAKNEAHSILAFDCDLKGSVKLDSFAKLRPEDFVQCGIAEQNALSVAASAAKYGITSIFAGFSVFALAEVYSQQRMADINHAPIKTFCTHAGLDVGEDGKTHQSIDYLSLASGLLNCRVMVPADPNQMDAVTRFALGCEGAAAVITGRSKTPVLTDKSGKVLFGEQYQFEYGKADWLLKGVDGCIITMGQMAAKALKLSEMLQQKGLKIGVLNISCPFDLDEEKLIQAAETGFVVTYEDHNVRSGLGSLAAMFYLHNQMNCRFYSKGISRYGISASPEANYEAQGLDERSMAEWILKTI